MSPAPTTAARARLSARGIVAGYRRDLPIVHGVDLDVVPGEVVVLLGPNGAGKSTLVKALAGVVATFAGQVQVDDRDVTALPAHARAAAGIGFVPQTANVFTTLSIDENLRVGGHRLEAAERRRQADAAYQRFPDLLRHRRQPASALSGGQRQMLAIARALMTAPRVLLLDEPSAGLSPKMVGEVFTQVRRIADDGIAVLMVEQNVKAGLGIADRGLILAGGRLAHQGPAATLIDDPVVAELYLGRVASAAHPA